MPVIERLQAAKAVHEAACLATSGLADQRQTLLDRIAELDRTIDEYLKPTWEALEEARKEQHTSLTRWVKQYDRCFTRYVLRESGPSDKCWDRRAWLRIRRVDKPWPPGKAPSWEMRRDPPHHYLWALQYDEYVDGKLIERHDTVLEQEPRSITEAEALAAADKLLTVGWHLTDLTNDGDADG